MVKPSLAQIVNMLFDRPLRQHSRSATVRLLSRTRQFGEHLASLVAIGRALPRSAARPAAPPPQWIEHRPTGCDLVHGLAELVEMETRSFNR